ncbi:probable receptor-like protein kinase At4g10390 [Salvia hispanica]|uniref:probable receptor-like protein kinase At4g10390 n=1 Tax=Salvia hispanica TaxID=49212 RepID=UPI002009315E|nr:probable receptor-like protein kinase At4g10390 [Salvia hispanica]XP_047952919.1 probable receptor-like protein kinase At4g10390 [Salvia hispanica]
MGPVKFLKRKLSKCKSKAAVSVDKSPKHSNSDGGGLRLSYEEIQKLTKDFATVIGYGGFSTVYLAQFRHSAAAVKLYCSSGSSQRVYDAFNQELQILLHIRHPNIVKLLGYAEDQGALIMEFVPNGTLHHKLHHASHTPPLAWNQRAAVAFQLASAIAYLHDTCAPHIVHADVKPSNVLLDGDLNCKLCDFGSARVGFSSAVAASGKRRSAAAMITGSPGYTDPLYLRTGLVSKKNDVYSFGVVVLELITGIEAFNPATGERLAARAPALLMNAAEMVDPRLVRGEVDLGEVRAMAELAAKCISETPGTRPSASEILTTMREAIPSLAFMFEKKVSEIRT